MPTALVKNGLIQEFQSDWHSSLHAAGHRAYETLHKYATSLIFALFGPYNRLRNCVQ